MSDDGPGLVTYLVRIPGQVLFDGNREPSLECTLQPVTPLSVLGIAIVGVKQYASARKKAL